MGFLSKYLCTTALTDFWGPCDTRKVFLGACSFSQAEETLSKAGIALEHPWRCGVDIENAYHTQKMGYEEILANISNLLNEIHNENKSIEYWRLIIGPWLYNYVQVYHERYSCIKEATRLHSNLKTIKLDRRSFLLPDCINDFRKWINSDFYNLQVYSVISEQLGMEGESISYEDKSLLSQSHRARIFSGRKATAYILTYFHKYFPILLSSGYLSKKENLQLMASAGGLLLPAVFDPGGVDQCIWTKTLHPQRKNLKSIARSSGQEEWIRLMSEALPDFLPKVYLEGYKFCRKFARRFYSGKKPEVLLTATSLLGNESFKYVAAHRKELGSCLVALQHGSGYGVAEFHPFEELERKAASSFWTWGWGNNGEKTTPMPHPKLLRLKKMSEKRDSSSRRKLLFVANEFPRHHNRTASIPMAEQNIEYMSARGPFIDGLSERCRAMLCIRKYPINYGWGKKNCLPNGDGNTFQDDSTGDYNELLTSSRLVVCDADLTTFLECLAADIPVVAFWNPKLWPIRSDAAPYYEDMRRAEIIFSNPEAAAEKVNEYFLDDTWWQAPAVIKARLKFQERFALVDQGWTTRWVKRLKTLRIKKETNMTRMWEA